jgi:hypothetical protein
MSKVDDILSALDWPLRQVKKQVSGDELEWFKPSDKIPHELYAAGNVALDFAGDPLNAVGGGLKALAKGAKQLPGAVASLSNYIPGHYGTKGMELGKMDKLLSSIGQKGGLSDVQSDMLGGYIGGKAKWAPAQLSNTLQHIMDPRSRALWDEQKTTRPAQKIVRGLLDDAADTRAIDKGVAQVQYSSHHIPEQAGMKASQNPAAQEILQRSFTEGVAPYSDEGLAAAMGRHGAEVLDDAGQVIGKVGVTPQEAAFAAQKIGKKQGMNDTSKFVLKNPGSGTFQTGGHYSDVVYGNPANSDIKKVFKNFADAEGNVSPAVLKKELFNIEKAQAAAAKAKNAGKNKAQRWAENKQKKGSWWTVKDAPEDEVWLEGGKIGAAVTEGGVGWLAKLEPDGTFKVFMHDKHDFVEKALPTVQKGLLPDDMLAVTPPMVTNIKGKGLKGAKIRDADGNIVKWRGADGSQRLGAKTQTLTGPDVRYKQALGEKTGGGYKDMLDEYAKATPSRKGVAKQSAGLLGELLLAQRAMDSETDL